MGDTMAAVHSSMTGDTMGSGGATGNTTSNSAPQRDGDMTGDSTLWHDR